MNNSNPQVERLTGALLVASFLVFMSHLVTFATLESAVPTILLVFVYGLLIFLAAAPLFLTFRHHGETLALFGTSALAAHGLLIVLTCALLLAGLDASQTAASAPSARALEPATKNFQSASLLFLGLGLIPLGVLITWRRAAAPWIGWLGVVGGTIASLSMSARLFGVEAAGLASNLLLIPLFIVFGFLLALGVRLFARGAPASHA